MFEAVAPCVIGGQFREAGKYANGTATKFPCSDCVSTDKEKSNHGLRVKGQSDDQREGHLFV